MTIFCHVRKLGSRALQRSGPFFWRTANGAHTHLILLSRTLHRIRGNQISIGESPFSQVVAQFEKRRALSVPKNTGRRGLYKTLIVTGSCRGRQFLGRAVVRSLPEQTESPPSRKKKPICSGFVPRAWSKFRRVPRSDQVRRFNAKVGARTLQAVTRCGVSARPP